MSSTSYDHQFLVSITSIRNIILDSWVTAVRILCYWQWQLDNSAHHIITDGGEGIVMRQPTSAYEHGRSTSLIKIKVSYDVSLDVKFISCYRHQGVTKKLWC